jgi:glycosyltransferase involved in cell wall biosynthesis
MVQGERKKALISRADIYTLPSYSEGFSMSILENLAAGKPLLITPGCNFPEVAEVGAGLSVNPVAEEIESGLRKLLDRSHEERKEMGERGRELVKNNYTWDIAARKMITVYRAILNKAPIPLFPEPAEPT